MHFLKMYTIRKKLFINQIALTKTQLNQIS